MNRLPRLLAIGTAVPDGEFSQESAALHASAVAQHADGQVPGGRSDAVLGVLYRRAGVHTRSTVLPDSGHDLTSYFPPALKGGPSTAQRMETYRAHAGTLAQRAAARAFEQTSVVPGDITHVVTASCTGFDAPGVDQHLMRSLGIPLTARRTNVGFMGCHAAINALAAAGAFAREDRRNRVLVVCVEICSLHFSYDADNEKRVANALFADGAAAAIVGADETADTGETPTIAGFASTLLPDSSELMTWRIGDHGFEMSLSPRVPGVLADHVPAWLDGMLEKHGLSRGAVASWAIHPGGPRLLSAITNALNLSKDADSASRVILAEQGNMSSATVLFIVERMLRDRPTNAPACPLVAAAFGPGLAGEAMLLR